jgi:hypothetical protein
MMTHVKRNAQRTSFYIKPDCMRGALSFKGIESKVNCSRIPQTSLNEDIILSKYLIQREKECRRYLFGGL